MSRGEPAFGWTEIGLFVILRTISRLSSIDAGPTEQFMPTAVTAGSAAIAAIASSRALPYIVSLCSLKVIWAISGISVIALTLFIAMSSSSVLENVSSSMKSTPASTRALA